MEGLKRVLVQGGWKRRYTVVSGVELEGRKELTSRLRRRLMSDDRLLRPEGY
jgi:hypothetical protein